MYKKSSFLDIQKTRNPTDFLQISWEFIQEE